MSTRQSIYYSRCESFGLQRIPKLSRIILLGVFTFILFDCDIPPHGILEIYNPDRHTTWEVGLDSAATIDWNAQNLEGPIQIRLLKDHERVMLISDTVDARSEGYTWTVPGSVQPGNGYSIYLESPTDSMAWTESETFRIDPYATNSKLDIIRPRQNDSWEIGLDDGAEITWDVEELPGVLKIDLLHGADVALTIADSVPALLETFIWTVPTTLTPGTEYQVRISSSEDEYLVTFSKSFRINAAPREYELEIINPLSKTRWMQQEINGAVIEWISEDLEGTFCIELMQEDTVHTTVIDSIEVTEGKYVWTVPLEVQPDNNYYVNLRSNLEPAVSTISRRFRIEEYDSTASLEITAPTRDHTWYLGEPDMAQINWAYRNVTGLVKLELYDRNSFYGIISGEIPVDDGSLIWTVPDTIPPGKGYKVYLESLDDPELNSMSEAFEIKALAEDQEIEILAPLQGEEWIIGIEDAALIEWQSIYLDSTIRIDLYDNQEFLFTIADEIDVLEGRYSWTVPDSIAPGKGYKVYVESNQNPDANDMSGRITISQPVAELEILKPSQGDEWIIGISDYAVIAWNSIYLDSTIRIDLYDNKNLVQTIATGIDVHEEQFIWTVPVSIPAGKGYKIYVESEADPEVSAWSARFSIVTPPAELELLRPGKGEEWVITEVDDAYISWSSSWLDSTINIELYDQNGYYLSIAKDIAVEQEVFIWTVTQGVVPGNGYKIFIQSNRDSTLTDLSGRIKISTPEPMLTLLSPSQGDEWIIGEANGANIYWNSEWLEGRLQLDLYNHKDLIATITDTTDVIDRSFLWTVPDSIPAGRGYFIKATSLSRPDIITESGQFQISQPERSLTILSPIKNDEWVIGDSLGAHVSWTYLNIDSTLSIELFKQNKFQTIITDSVSVSVNEYLWTVPDSIEAGKGYNVRLKSHKYLDIEAKSGSFSLTNP